MDQVTAMNVAVGLAKPFEGYHKRLPDGSCTTYVCPGGVLTIGYGSTGPHVTPGLVITQPQAEALLQSQMAGSLSHAVRLAPNLSAEPSRKAGAIADFVFNLGPTAFKASTLRKRILAGDWARAQQEIKRWNKAGGRVLGGLVARRQAEADLLAA